MLPRNALSSGSSFGCRLDSRIRLLRWRLRPSATRDCEVDPLNILCNRGPEILLTNPGLRRSARGLTDRGIRNQEAQPVRQVRRIACLLYTSPSPRDLSTSRMPSSA